MLHCYQLLRPDVDDAVLVALWAKSRRLLYHIRDLRAAASVRGFHLRRSMCHFHGAVALLAP